MGAIAKHLCWDPASIPIALELVRYDVDFTDIGANIGWFMLVAGDVGGGPYQFEIAAIDGTDRSCPLWAVGSSDVRT